MENQHKITQPLELLDEKGHLTEPGYATKLLWRYDRRKIKAGWHRIKEWDYFAILDPEKKYGITFTISDLGYIGLIAVVWLDFENKNSTQYETMSILPRGKTGFPSDSGDGIIEFKDKKISLKFEYTGSQRIITVDCPKFINKKGERGLKGKLTLNQDPNDDTMVIATSWKENRKAFYYNQKVNCMPTEGIISIGDHDYSFSPDSSMGVLDWGRGNWTYKNRWYWGSASGYLNGEKLGWNIGYGFSDRSPASENMVFYKGKAYKLDEVTFHIDTTDYMKPWKFSSNDERFEMDFEPILDRQGKTNFLIIKSIQHQVFGYYTGYLVLDDGTKLKVDRFLGFAEDVLNWW
ncbi:MAG: DUF2804 domain-containing protein [Promethearchaeota archaeon]